MHCGFGLSGRADFNLAGGFAANDYGVHSTNGYSLKPVVSARRQAFDSRRRVAYSRVAYSRDAADFNSPTT
jgi:hypothetical protein